MAEGSSGTKPAKKLVEIDIISDTVCPWCFVGKRNLDKAVEASNGRYDFRVLFYLYSLIILALIIVHDDDDDDDVAHF